MNSLRYSPQALRDLEEIWEYISAESENHAAACKTVNSIMEFIDKLRNFVSLGAPLSSVAGPESGYRF